MPLFAHVSGSPERLVDVGVRNGIGISANHNLIGDFFMLIWRFTLIWREGEAERRRGGEKERRREEAEKRNGGRAKE